MPRRIRTTRNTQYTVQIEQVTSKEKNQLLIEDGALIQSDSTIYAGIDNEWVQLAPINNNSLQVGWARYDDGQYNSENPYIFGETAFVLPNDATIKIDDYNLNMYDADTQKITLQQGCTYALTVAFKAFMNNNNAHAELLFNVESDADYSNIADVISFPKGNGISHTFSRSFNFYCNGDAELDGIQLYFIASHEGGIYDVIYFIEKLSHA